MENNKETNFVSAVVYCHNDAVRVDSFLTGLLETLAKKFNKYEIIVVNDYSMDESEKTIRSFVANHSQLGGVVTLLNMSHLHGLERSMNAGVNLAIGDFVYEFDYMDVDYDWSVIGQIYDTSLTGYDIVSANPDKQMTLTSRFYYCLFNHYAHMQYNLSSETFRILSRRAINRVHSLAQDMPFRRAAYANCGLAMACVSYKPTSQVKHEKRAGRMTLAIDSLVLFTDLAYRATITLTMIMLCIAIGIGVYAFVYKLLSNPVAGWTTTSLFISIGFSGLFAILTMVVKYLQILLNLQFRKKTYLFESINKLQ